MRTLFLQFLYLILFHVSVEAVSPEILSRLMHDDSAETEEGDEVRDGHEGVHAVGDVPYQAEADDAADEDGCDIDDTETEHPLLTLEIFHATLAIVAPTEGGAEGEGSQSEGEQWGTDVRYLAKGSLGQCRSIMVVDVGIGDDAGGYHESCQGTDNHRVPEGSCG